MTQPRILIYDIETAPMFGAIWRLWKNTVTLDQLERDWFLLSYSAKWLGQDAIIYRDQRESPPNMYEYLEYDLIQGLHSLLNSADIVVAHNGKRFDNRRANAKFIEHGLPPVHNYKVVDTLLESRKLFDFPSHSLQYLTEKLLPPRYWKRKSEKFPGYKLWEEVLAGNQDAWKEMEQYNRQDVVALEALYLKMRPWIVGHPNVGNLTNSEPGKPTCPKCGSSNVHRRGTYHTQTQRYQRYCCNSCGGWSRGRFTTSDKTKRHNILVN